MGQGRNGSIVGMDPDPPEQARSAAIGLLWVRIHPDALR
jgi:hypothetical protein